MATLTLSTFSKYQLSEQEEQSGTLLPQDIKLRLQNLICMIAEEKLALVPNPNNYAEFIQQEAHLAGQLVAYRYLLDCSLATETILLEAARSTQQ